MRRRSKQDPDTASVRPSGLGGRRLLLVMLGTVGVFVLTSAPAFAAPPEEPVTETPSPLGGTTATFKGELNPGAASAAVRYHFAYTLGAGGCSESGHVAPAEPFPEASGNHKKVSVPITGLEGSSEYSVCLVAANPAEEAEVTQGTTVEFTTAPAKPVIGVESASVQPFDASLEAFMNPENRVTAYYFEYAAEEGLIGSAAAKIIGGGSIPRATEEQATGPVDIGGGLAANTTYYYRVVASNSAGTTDGEIEPFTTASPELPLIEEEPTPTGVGQSTASVSARINPELQETTCEGFQYGPTASYGSLAPCEPENLGAGISGELTGANLTNLAANTEYHYNVLAKNATGETEGADQTFLTLPNPPTVTTSAASGITATSATISGTVNPGATGRPSQDETTYYFQYGHTTSYGQQTPLKTAGEGETLIPETAALGGLEPGGNYHYRIIATNNNNGTPQTSYGDDQAFPTPTAPPILTSVTLAGVTQTTVTISATLEPQGQPTRYELQLSATPGQLQPVLNGNTTITTPLTLTATALTPNTTYYYKLTATNANGATQAEGTFTTAPAVSTTTTTPSLPPLILYTPITQLNAQETLENKPTTHSTASPLSKALKRCRKIKNHHNRFHCEQQAHKKHSHK
jgi:hypothetical protein